ncbi:hypothetical protein Taro_030651 [Colocasia esculenta]|uniref:Uncharacterized protein n=1 Tax=Colocasia esculenta TaxID=4460 RepID=A0A843VGV2_COLES|nr:hypothetical protein [Colocasia esculenta]
MSFIGLCWMGTLVRQRRRATRRPTANVPSSTKSTTRASGPRYHLGALYMYIIWNIKVLLVFSILVGASAWVDLLLPASSDESMEALSLSKENEVEEVDPEQPKIQLGDSDEEEYISDQNESDNEDVNAEFDISPTSEDEMENMKIWFEDDVGLLQVGGERVVGGDLLLSTPLPPTSAPLPPAVGPTTSIPVPRAVEPTTSAPLLPAAGPTTSAHLPLASSRLTASASPSHMASGSTPPPFEPVHADDETSHHEGEGSYNETMRAVWINEGGIIDSQSIQMGYMLDLHGQLLQEQISNINAERACASTDKNQWKEHGPVWMRKEYWIELCDIWGAEKWNENSAKAKQNRTAHPEANVHTSGSVSFPMHKARLEVQLKRPPQFQELFDETHKKKGTNDYISEKAREVAESYSRGMDERYGDDNQRPELDPDIWVAASAAPKKGNVYGFGHSLGMARVISSCSSSVSHATSPFTTPAAPGGSSSAAPTMTPDMFREIVNETVSQNISTIVSQTVYQTLA